MTLATPSSADGRRTVHLRLAAAGFVSLVGAMGIGRFLLTPAIPMMAEAGMEPATAGWVASANFLGYLLGALAGTLPIFTARPRAWLIAGLAASVATTAGMALSADPLAWAALRFAGGLASAAVLVTVSGLAIGTLQTEGRSDLALVPFAGVGTGIAISAFVAGPWAVEADGWRAVWLAGGAVTLASLGAVAWLVPSGSRPTPRPIDGRGDGRGLVRLVLSYGCFGFGYVVSATFIVAILREGAGDRTAEALVWMAVGLAGIPSLYLWGLVARRTGRVRAYMLALAVCATGSALTTLGDLPGVLALAAACLGGTFMAITAVGLQEAARRSRGEAQRAMAAMTAAFGVGQMIGPAVAGQLREATGTYAWPCLLAALVLVIGAATVVPLRERR